MAYIAPNSTIEFFGDLGLSPNYEDTFYFASTAAKDSFFAQQTKVATAASCTYVRGERGKVRVQIGMNPLIYAHYMRYKNTSFENKWFYAFITRVNYINNQTSEVEFIPDVVMSWMGAFTLGGCLVEREHVINDTIGAHLMDEGLSVGDYVIAAQEQITPYSPIMVVSSSALYDVAEQKVIDAEPTKYYGNMISSVTYIPIEVNDTGLAKLSTLIEKLTAANKSDAVISIRLVPIFCDPTEYLGTGAPPNLGNANSGTFTSSFSLTSIDGYTPRNKKLFSYPYCLYEALNGEGSANEYRLEFFSTPLVPSFYYAGVSFDNCEIALIPRGYRTTGVAQIYDEMLIMRQFPQVSFNVDQYKAYLAQISSGGGWVNIAGSIARTIGTAAGSAALNPALAPAAAAGAITSLASQALDLLGEKIKYESMPPAVRGTSNANIMSAIGQKRFTGYYKTIKAEYAIAIDRYFDMYGYKVNTVKIPSMHSRPYWTYCKTSGCVVHGSLPAEDAAQIENCFNRGIRFWDSSVTIGNYNLNNSPA